MAQFIELTSAISLKKMYINVSIIETFFINKKDTHTSIYTIHDDKSCYAVIETPEEIYQKLVKKA